MITFHSNVVLFNRSVSKAVIIRNHRQIENRVNLLADKCARATDAVRDEMAKLMVLHQMLDNQNMADKLLDFLSDKYDTYHWLVLVYNGIEGGHKHWQTGHYHHVFRRGGKNALAVSQINLIEKTQEIQNSSLTIASALAEAIKTSCEEKCDWDDARQLVDHLSTYHPLANSTLFAIDHSANVVKGVDPNFAPHYWDKVNAKEKIFFVLAITHEHSPKKAKTHDLRGHRIASDSSGSARSQPSLEIFSIIACTLTLWVRM